MVGCCINAVQHSLVFLKHEVMKDRSLTSIFLIAWLVTTVFGQDEWAKYKPRTLKQIVTIFAKASFRDPDYVLRDKGQVVFILSANTFPSLVTVKYTGKSRTLSAKKKEVIAAWLKVYGPKNPEYLHLFDTEILFTEGRAAYWLPVQVQMVPFFEQELQKGENVHLYLVWVGGRKDSGKIERVFLVNEFKKEE